MPFEIVRNDITRMKVDAIVNSANPSPVTGEGVDSAIHKAAGPELLKARKKIGDIKPGQAKITEAFLLNSRYVIHTVGPVWYGGIKDEYNLLTNCYISSLKLAVEYKCKSIAFPLISTGNYGFPKDMALKIAINGISDFLLYNDLKVYLVVFDTKSFTLSEKLTNNVKKYIDDNYSEVNLYDVQESCRIEDRMSYIIENKRKIEDILNELDESFTERLLRLIDNKGYMDVEVYKRANIDRKLFSKIRSNKDYRPSKKTALSLAIALRLNIDETLDLISKAGYTLSRSSKSDVIVEYFINSEIYDVYEINSVLFKFNQPLLC